MSERRRLEAHVSRVYGSAGFGSESSPRVQQALVPSRDMMPSDTPSMGSGSVMVKGSKGRRKKNGAFSSRSAGGVPSSSSESALSQGDYDRYDIFYQKRRGALGVITGIFTCWSKTKEGQSGSFQGRQTSSASVVPRLNGLTAAALLEQAKVQQEALLETQDTSDMWEWYMEQQQAIASQEHELLERSSSGGGADNGGGEDGRPLIRRKSRTDDEDAEADDALDEWESPTWGWRRQEEVGDEKVVQMLEAALLRCRWEVNTFCRVYMQQIVRAGYSLINTMMEMEPNTVFLRRVHASYALEARINAALFRYFENDSFDDSGLTHIFDPAARAASRLQEYVRIRGLDPAEALRMHSPSYEPAFHNFAAAKSEEVLALLPPSALAFRSAAQRDRFMDALLRAAKWAWLLHRLATSSTPATTILRVARGHPVDPVYVEAVAVPPIGSCTRCPVTAQPAVEFMIMPGFVAQRKVFRCRVYQHFMCKQ